MNKLIKSAGKYYKKLESGDATNDHAYEEAIASLRKMRKHEAPFSSFCVAYLDSYRHEDFLSGVFA